LKKQKKGGVDIYNHNNDLTLPLGQSGSRVELVSSLDNSPIVRKFANYSNIERLELQFKKHQEANFGLMSPIKTPKIIKPYELEIGFYDMQFIRADQLGKFLQGADSEQMNLVSEIIVSFFRNQFINAKVDETINDRFAKKLDELSDKDKKSDNTFRSLRKFTLDMNNKMIHLGGWNHGDFSFENILVSNDGAIVSAIDFLDSPFDSPMIDLGRIWLDVKYGWWGAGFSEPSNMRLNRGALEKNLLNFALEIGINQKEIELFSALAILRIIPYTENVTRLSFLKFAASKIMKGEK
jgi:hypothetical protein